MENPNEEVKYPQYTIQARVKDTAERLYWYKREELEAEIHRVLKDELLLELEELEVKEY